LASLLVQRLRVAQQAEITPHPYLKSITSHQFGRGSGYWNAVKDDGRWYSDIRSVAGYRVEAMTPEEALRNILSLVDGSDEIEDVHALQILLQSIKTLAEKGLGRSE
jgi:hypothetical protein